MAYTTHHAVATNEILFLQSVFIIKCSLSAFDAGTDIDNNHIARV